MARLLLNSNGEGIPVNLGRIGELETGFKEGSIIDIRREKVWEILRENISSEALLRHSIAVEAVMRAYAAKFGENEHYWGAVGLLHDIDYEKYPEKHPLEAEKILKGYGYDEVFIDNVLAHGYDWKAERTLLQKTLVAADALASFILACARARPDKSLDTLDAEFVLEKIKDPAFARSVSRERIFDSAAELGVELKEHIEFIRKALAHISGARPSE